MKNIRNHEIIHEINRGAITTVYKAKHLNLNRFVLLKVLNPQWLKEQDLLKRFKREAQISAHLQHPNIVNVYDFEISPELVFISLEFIDGQTLSNFIKNESPLSVDKIIHILQNSLNALNYAHKKGVIHRDLKPDNILLDKNLKASLTDFGLASFSDIPAITEQGQSMGTPAYMAPEQIQGKTGDAKSDLYSLGIVLYEMISNTSPFLKDNTAATLQSILSDSLIDVGNFRPDIPHWLSSLTKDLTNKDPHLRPNNPREILEKHFNEVEEIPATKKSAKNKRGVLYFIAASVVMILFVIYFGTGDNPSVNPLSKSSAPDSVSERVEATVDTSSVNNENVPKSINIVDSFANINRKYVDQPKKIEASNEPIETYGGLFVVCTPWATVFLDGDQIDTTPMNDVIQIKTGKHVIKLINPNYKTVIYEIEVSPDKIDTLNVRLEPNFGYLMVKASPWAQLFINGTYKEDTPLQKAIIIPAGNNIIKLQNPSFETITDTIFVEAGKSIEKIYSFIN